MKRKAIAIVALFAGFAAGANFAQAAGKPDNAGDGPGRFDKLKNLDADRDGAVSAAEFAKEQQERFTKRDINKDGKLDATEVVATRGGKMNTGDRSDRLMKRYDANADDRVTREEFDAGQKAWFAKRDKDGDGKLGQGEAPRRFGLRGARPEIETLDKVIERGAARFKGLDVNGDNVIEASEVAAAETAKSEYRLKKAMHRLDQNRDGTVSPDEFMAQARQRFGNLDLDSDGRITAEDLPPQARIEWNAR